MAHWRQRPGLSDVVEPDFVNDHLASMMPERELQQAIEDHFRERGWFVYHARTAPGSEPGLLDLVMMRPPRVIFMELKSMKGKLDERLRYSRRGNRVLPTQKEWFDGLEECPGVETYLIRPIDWFNGTVDRISE